MIEHIKGKLLIRMIYWMILTFDRRAGQIFHAQTFEIYNIKAIILKNRFQYEDVLKYYDKALSMDESNETILKNKAECIRSKLEADVTFNRIEPHHLELINCAVKILPKGYDTGSYLNVKAKILDRLGEPVKAWLCRGLAAKDYDAVDKVEKQLKKMKSGGRYINIT